MIRTRSGMQPVPYLTRSSFFPAIEAALDVAGADFDELKVYLGPRGYKRDEIIEVPGPDGEHLSTSWRGDPGRFSARIRAAATALHRRGIHGRYRAIHANGLLALRRESRALARDPDQHDWRFTGHTITTLLFDAASVRIQSWRLDGTADIRLGAPFTLMAPDGNQTSVDPDRPITCAFARAARARTTAADDYPRRCSCDAPIRRMARNLGTPSALRSVGGGDRGSRGHGALPVRAWWGNAVEMRPVDGTWRIVYFRIGFRLATGRHVEPHRRMIA